MRQKKKKVKRGKVPWEDGVNVDITIKTLEAIGQSASSVFLHLHFFLKSSHKQNSRQVGFKTAQGTNWPSKRVFNTGPHRHEIKL